MTNVVSPWGYLSGEPQVNESLVEELKRLLEMAEAGEIVGIACAHTNKDGTASYSIAGLMGGFSMLGAMTTATALVQDHVLEGIGE